MIAYRFRVYFEDEDEVERIIDIRAGQTLFDLHRIILETISFKPDTPTHFFRSGDNWRKGTHYSSTEDGGGKPMEKAKLNGVVFDPHQKFIFTTEGPVEWELRVVLRKIFKADMTAAYPHLVKSIGVAPKQVPVTKIGSPTNEFEQMVDELMQEDPHEISDDTLIDGESDLGTPEDK